MGGAGSDGPRSDKAPPAASDAGEDRAEVGGSGGTREVLGQVEVGPRQLLGRSRGEVLEVGPKEVVGKVEVGPKEALEKVEVKPKMFLGILRSGVLELGPKKLWERLMKEPRKLWGRLRWDPKNL